MKEAQMEETTKKNTYKNDQVAIGATICRARLEI